MSAASGKLQDGRALLKTLRLPLSERWLRQSQAVDPLGDRFHDRLRPGTGMGCGQREGADARPLGWLRHRTGSGGVAGRAGQDRPCGAARRPRCRPCLPVRSRQQWLRLEPARSSTGSPISFGYTAREPAPSLTLCGRWARKPTSIAMASAQPPTAASSRGPPRASSIRHRKGAARATMSVSLSFEIRRRAAPGRRGDSVEVNHESTVWINSAVAGVHPGSGRAGRPRRGLRRW